MTIKAELKVDAKIVRGLLVKFIKDQISNAGFAKGVIGISGGVDSAVAAALAAEALGKDNVLGIMLPYRYKQSKKRRGCKARYSKDRYSL